MIKNCNHRISLTFAKDDYVLFERLYPNCLSKFLRNCIRYSLRDKKFFEQIYFEDLDLSLIDRCANSMIKKLDEVI